MVSGTRNPESRSTRPSVQSQSALLASASEQCYVSPVQGLRKTLRELHEAIDELDSPLSLSRHTTSQGYSGSLNHETRSERDFWRPDSGLASLTSAPSRFPSPESDHVLGLVAPLSTTPQSPHVRWVSSPSEEIPWAGISRSSVSPAPTLDSEEESETDTQRSLSGSPDSDPDSALSSTRDSDSDSDSDSDITQSFATVKKVQWMKNHEPFVSYKKTSKTSILVPPEFDDLKPGDLFVRLDPDTLDTIQTWVWAQERVWRDGQDGDVHPFLLQHRLSLRRIDGKLTANWILKSSHQAYKQRARKLQILEQVSQSLSLCYLNQYS